MRTRTGEYDASVEVSIVLDDDALVFSIAYVFWGVPIGRMGPYSERKDLSIWHLSIVRGRSIHGHPTDKGHSSMTPSKRRFDIQPGHTWDAIAIVGLQWRGRDANESRA